MWPAAQSREGAAKPHILSPHRRWGAPESGGKLRFRELGNADAEPAVRPVASARSISLQCRAIAAWSVHISCSMPSTAWRAGPHQPASGLRHSSPAVMLMPSCSSAAHSSCARRRAAQPPRCSTSVLGGSGGGDGGVFVCTGWGWRGSTCSLAQVRSGRKAARSTHTNSPASDPRPAT